MLEIIRPTVTKAPLSETTPTVRATLQLEGQQFQREVVLKLNQLTLVDNLPLREGTWHLGVDGVASASFNTNLTENYKYVELSLSAERLRRKDEGQSESTDRLRGGNGSQSLFLLIILVAGIAAFVHFVMPVKSTS